MSKTIKTPSQGGLARFTKKRSTCVGCKAVLDTEGMRERERERERAYYRPKMSAWLGCHESDATGRPLLVARAPVIIVVLAPPPLLGEWWAMTSQRETCGSST